MSFLNSSAKRTELETRNILTQSHIESGAVSKATCNGSNNVAETCRVIDVTFATTKYLLVKYPSSKIDFVLDLQFIALNTWTSPSS